MRWTTLTVTTMFMTLGLLAAPRTGLADQASDYASLRSAFNSGKYDLALRQLQAHPEGTAVYFYNLGTTLLRLNRAGQATAYLEKANRIQPHDVAIQQNLQLARNALVEKIGPDRLDPASTWLENLADNLRLDEIRGILGLVGFVIALFWIRCYLKTRRLRETLMKPAGWLGIFALAITAGLYGLERISGANPVAICLQHTSIRSGPGASYLEVSEAEAGEKLRALGPTSQEAEVRPDPSPLPSASPSSSPAATAGGATSQLWRQVRYSSDGIGWVPASDVLLL